VGGFVSLLLLNASHSRNLMYGVGRKLHTKKGLGLDPVLVRIGAHVLIRAFLTEDLIFYVK
jgi:hypothetical protein